VADSQDVKFAIALVLLVLLGSTGTAVADGWLSIELPTAVPLTDVQQEAFSAGALPAIGSYISLNGHLSIGTRWRAGALRSDAAPHVGASPMPPTAGGLVTAGLAGRINDHGAYIELVAGGGIMGREIVPAFELGAGYIFDFDQVAVGPSARYVRLDANTSAAVGSADLVLVGVDIQYGHEHRRRTVPHLVSTGAPPVPLTVVEANPFMLRDDDRVVDRAPSCADLLEYLDPYGGCPGATIDVSADSLRLDDRISFDADQARIHAEGRELIMALVKTAANHPEWLAITLAGYADDQGSDQWNLQLSELRAVRAREAMVRAGFPAERLHTVGYGRSRPRDLGTTPEAHHRNRRVEFVIERAWHEAP
jgi:outer membrane protein OmpA-like peptidoglycan-associated protein